MSCYLVVIGMNAIFMSWTSYIVILCPMYAFVTFCWSLIVTYMVEIKFVELCLQGPFHNWWARDITSDHNEWSACWSQCRRNTAVSPGIPVYRWAWGSVPSGVETRAGNSKRQHIWQKTSHLSLYLCCVNYYDFFQMY